MMLYDDGVGKDPFSLQLNPASVAVGFVGETEVGFGATDALREAAPGVPEREQFAEEGVLSGQSHRHVRGGAAQTHWNSKGIHA